ncbi:uncharacterized protein [Periplaneta americana]|uniref:uncharacterized protein n=1 Tax=Periplaneta americana TaxID=6978 RepID=UPI0037E87B09
MNKMFKMGNTKPRSMFNSPYQRPVSGSSGGKHINIPNKNDCTMGTSTRFQSPGVYCEQSEKNMSTRTLSNKQYVSPDYDFTTSWSSPRGFPFFRHMPEAPFHFDFQSHTPLDTDALNYADTDNTYENQYEDVTSQMQTFCQDVLIDKDLTSTTNISTSNKSGHRNQIELPNNKDTKKMSYDSTAKRDKGPARMVKTWKDDSRAMKILTGSTDKISKWQNLRETSKILFEVIATLVTVRPAGSLSSKMLLLRDQSTPVLECIFQEIDRPLPPLDKGKLVRCVGKIVAKNKMTAFSVRTASSSEKSGLQRLSFASQRAATAMGLAIAEP